MSVKAHMLKNFTVLPTRLTLASAAARLAPGEFGVVVTSSQRPVALVTLEDLKTAAGVGHRSLAAAAKELPRTLIAGSRVEMDLLARGVVHSIRAGARGTVVLGRTGIVGVVPVECAITYMRQDLPTYGPVLTRLRNLNFMSSSRTGSVMLTMEGVNRSLASGSLAGAIRKTGKKPCNPYVCAECGFQNCFAFAPRAGREPQCQNKDPKVEVHKFKFAI